MGKEQDHYAREGRLEPRDAVVAIIRREDGRYLLQLRDQKPGIFFPGHWGMFGGAMDADETPEVALRRELREELGIEVGDLVYFTKLTFDFAPHGFGTVARHYYETRLSRTQEKSIVLGEGADIRAWEGETLLKVERVTPYDAFVIWMHLTRAGRSQI